MKFNPFASPVWPCSSNTPGRFTPQGVCTCPSLNLRFSTLRCLHGFLPDLHQVLKPTAAEICKQLPDPREDVAWEVISDSATQSNSLVCPGKQQGLGKGNFSSVTQSCPTLCDPMDCSTPGLPVHHLLTESTQTHFNWVSNAVQTSHPLSSPSPPAFNLSQRQGLFQWVSSSHQVAKVLEFQLQHQSFQWTPRTDLL